MVVVVVAESAVHELHRAHVASVVRACVVASGGQAVYDDQGAQVDHDTDKVGHDERDQKVHFAVFHLKSDFIN